MRFLIPSIAIIILTAIDQITKFIAQSSLMGKADVNFIEGILSFSYHTNEGMAFGLFQGGRYFFLIMAIVILSAIFYYYSKLGNDKISKLIKVCLILISAGAVGNSIDRFFRRYVIDFFQTDFINFPIFNVADIYVVTGTILLSILILFFVKEESVE